MRGTRNSRELRRFWKLPHAYEALLDGYEGDVYEMLMDNGNTHGLNTGLRLFYMLKPLVPRGIQISLRRIRAWRIRRKNPHWPVDDRLERLKRLPFKKLTNNTRIPFIWFWPNRKQCACVVTHDVETKKGFARMDRILEIEMKHGVRSSWNFVPQGYKVGIERINQLHRYGFEVGVHGLKHDGRLFESKKTFDTRMSVIMNYARLWEAIGFRSPALHRTPAWLRAIPFQYDSSIPDTDPFEPQPGGCYSVFPFFLGNVVELPVTTPQDHTLFDILGCASLRFWLEKIEYIESVGGMILIIVHPDFTATRQRLALYEQLIVYLKEKRSFWFTLPRDVAQWWLKRDRSMITWKQVGSPAIQGPAVNEGSIRWIDRDGCIFHEM
jgi:peptidoglycan/xylan/chitin deacetylase (PgdA/CDA1 family)